MKLTRTETKKILEMTLEEIENDYPGFNGSLLTVGKKLERIDITLASLPSQIKEILQVELAETRNRIESFIRILNQPESIIQEKRNEEGMREIFFRTTAPFLDRIIEKIKEKIKELERRRK